MTVKELIQELSKWPEDTRVYVDWDRDGGNEDEVSSIEEYKAWWCDGGVKIT